MEIEEKRRKEAEMKREKERIEWAKREMERKECEKLELEIVEIKELISQEEKRSLLLQSYKYNVDANLSRELAKHDHALSELNL